MKREVIGTQGIARDITDRERSEEALRLSNLWLRTPDRSFQGKAQKGWPVEFVSNNVVQFGYKLRIFLSGALPYASIIYPDDLKSV